jgi:threonine dehydrogenase-like Zn-dependent dehydrogenase
MADDVRAVVHTGLRTFEHRTLPRPVIGHADALLRVEACGICGTDVERYKGNVPVRYPVIPGHEPVGVIEEIGPGAAARWGVAVGDRVAVDPFVPCGSCRDCLGGSYELCQGWPGVRSYGGFPMTNEPGLWGGFATHLYLHPNSIVYPVPAHVPADLAVLYNPLGAGVRWGVTVPGTTIGSTVAVLGSGQRGLACVVAAKAAGASLVIATGLASDAHKLALARELGADVTITVDAHRDGHGGPGSDRGSDRDRDDLHAAVRDHTGGRGVDIVVDTTPHAAGPVRDAVAIARMGGTVVLGGLKGRGIDGFPVDDVALKALRVFGVRGVGAAAYRAAIDLLADGRVPIGRMRTHTFRLADAAHAVEVLAGEVPDEQPVNIVITP